MCSICLHHNIKYCVCVCLCCGTRKKCEWTSKYQIQSFSSMNCKNFIVIMSWSNYSHLSLMHDLARSLSLSLSVFLSFFEWTLSVCVLRYAFQRLHTHARCVCANHLLISHFSRYHDRDWKWSHITQTKFYNKSTSKWNFIAICFGI